MNLKDILASLLVASTASHRSAPMLPTGHWGGSSNVFIPRRWRRSYASHRREARRRRNIRLFNR